MSATITVYDGLTNHGPVIASFEIKDLRVQPIDRAGSTGYVIGDRFMDAAGNNVTDVEHDNAWKMRLELIELSTKVVKADYTVITGIVVELQRYLDGVEIETWLCDSPHCDGFHSITDRYTPPAFVYAAVGKFCRVDITHREEAE